MIASDYDGTLYPFNAREVPFYTKQTIHRYIENGGIFALCTGRIFSSILPEAQKLELSGDLICLQGSAAYSIADQKLIFSECLSVDETVKILEYAEHDNRICHLYYQKDYYAERPNDFTEIYAAYCNVLPVYTHCKLSQYASQNNIQAFKIIILTSPEESDEVLRKTREYLKDSADVSKSGPMFVEVVSASSGKGNAVKRLAAIKGIPIEEVAVFGDALNDVSMLKVAGLSVAVDNAMEDVKQVADIITDSAENCGVAKIIEKIIDNNI